jgi:hypothetical protein
MKILTIILISFSFNVLAYIEDSKPQMDCKRVAGAGKIDMPDILRCEDKKEVCFIYAGTGLSCYPKKEQ